MSKKNRKIQLRLYPSDWSNSYWILQYRIHPSERSWFGRLFNFWKTVYIFDEDGLSLWKSEDECWCAYAISSHPNNEGLSIFNGLKKQLVDENSLQSFFDEQIQIKEKALNKSEYVNGRIVY